MLFPLKNRSGKIVYSVGNMGLTGFLQLMSVYLLFFLIDEVHMDPWLTSHAEKAKKLEKMID